MGATTREEREALIGLLAELEYRRSRKKLFVWFPEDGPHARHLYPRHMLFFSAGREFKTRAFIAGNRIGKTVVNAYETTLHLTGLYPDWWAGHRFDKPVDWWMGGDTAETVRDILQVAMFGDQGQWGTGMIPGDLIIGQPTVRPNTGRAIDYALVRHVTGGMSRLGMKSYDQGRRAWQGTAKDGVGLDEEGPEDVRNEAVLRLMTTSGLLIETFTPLKGRTAIVEHYMGKGAKIIEDYGVTVRDGRVMVQAGWNHVPHLGEDEKARMRSETPPHLREARENGTPTLGSGVIYPIAESDIKVKDFELPDHWPRVYALDVGWKRTAGLWGAVDLANDTLYIYSELYRSNAEPPIIAAAVKAKGPWIPGVIDPAGGASQVDGNLVKRLLRAEGLHLTDAENSVEAGIYNVWGRISTGRIKVFASCQNFFSEYRVYRRDEKGRIVKDNDHLMDALRYLVMTGLKRAALQPSGRPKRGPSNVILDPLAGY